jgi:hypothetical protein
MLATILAAAISITIIFWLGQNTNDTLKKAVTSVPIIFSTILILIFFWITTIHIYTDYVAIKYDGNYKIECVNPEYKVEHGCNKPIER